MGRRAGPAQSVITNSQERVVHGYARGLTLIEVINNFVQISRVHCELVFGVLDFFFSVL